MGEHNFSVENVTEIMTKVSQLDVKSMPVYDQLLFMAHVTKFAEAMKPLVDKYYPAQKKKGDLFDELMQYFKQADAEKKDADIKPEDDGVGDAED